MDYILFHSLHLSKHEPYSCYKGKNKKAEVTYGKNNRIEEDADCI